MENQSKVYKFRIGDLVKTSPDGEDRLKISITGEVVGIIDRAEEDILLVLLPDNSTKQLSETHFVPPDDWRER